MWSTLTRQCVVEATDMRRRPAARVRWECGRGPLRHPRGAGAAWCRTSSPAAHAGFADTRGGRQGKSCQCGWKPWSWVMWQSRVCRLPVMVLGERVFTRVLNEKRQTCPVGFIWIFEKKVPYFFHDFAVTFPWFLLGIFFFFHTLSVVFFPFWIN